MRFRGLRRIRKSNRGHGNVSKTRTTGPLTANPGGRRPRLDGTFVFVRRRRGNGRDESRTIRPSGKTGRPSREKRNGAFARSLSARSRRTERVVSKQLYGNQSLRNNGRESQVPTGPGTGRRRPVETQPTTERTVPGSGRPRTDLEAFVTRTPPAVESDVSGVVERQAVRGFVRNRRDFEIYTAFDGEPARSKA